MEPIGVSGTSEKVAEVFEQAPAAGEFVPEGGTGTVLYSE
jgi:hypothetical protein